MFLLAGRATIRSQSPDEPQPDESHARLVGDLAVPTGMEYVRVEAVGLVTGLHGTGSDPALRRIAAHCWTRCKPAE